MGINKECGGSNGFHRATELATREDVEKKIGKEILSTKQLAVYLDVDEKTIKNHIKKLHEIIGDDNFKKHFTKNGVYVVKPELQRIFICLFKLKNAQRHKDSSIYRKKYYDGIMEIIDKYLEEPDKSVLKGKVSYENKVQEKELIDQYYMAWFMFDDALWKSNYFQRSRVIKLVIDFLGQMKTRIRINDREINQQKRKIDLLQSTMMVRENYSDSLETTMIAMMINKINQKGIEEEPDGNKMIHEFFKHHHLLKSEKGWLGTGLFSVPADKYKVICEKIDQIFDKEDDIEKKLAEHMKRLVKDIFIAPFDDNNCEAIYEEQDVGDFVYKNFFKTYESISDYLNVIQSSEYKKYLEVKDSEEFKKFISRI